MEKVIIAVAILIAGLLFFFTGKKEDKKVLRVIGVIISILGVAALGICAYYLLAVAPGLTAMLF